MHISNSHNRLYIGQVASETTAVAPFNDEYRGG